MSSNTRTVLQAGIDLLKLLDDLGVPAVIAGGFCRDYVCHRPIRDIDLYVSCLDFNEVYMKLREAEDTVFNKDTLRLVSTNTEEYGHQYIQCCIEFEGGEAFKKQFPELADFPINLIGLRHDSEVKAEIDGASIVSRFNLSMSQAWIDADSSTCRYSQNFVRDARLAQNTVLRSDWGHETTVQNILKFKRKYPDVTIVNADGTRWYADEFLHGAYTDATDDGQPTEQQEWLDFDPDC